MKSGPKVFIVNEDSTGLESLSALLTSQGYHVKSFPSAEEFIAQHHPSQVGCVLIDLQVPEMSRGKLLRMLDESGSLLSVVVIPGPIDSSIVNDNLPEQLSEEPNEASNLSAMISDGVADSVRRRALRRHSTKFD